MFIYKLFSPIITVEIHVSNIMAKQAFLFGARQKFNKRAIKFSIDNNDKVNPLKFK